MQTMQVSSQQFLVRPFNGTASVFDAPVPSAPKYVQAEVSLAVAKRQRERERRLRELSLAVTMHTDAADPPARSRGQLAFVSSARDFHSTRAPARAPALQRRHTARPRGPRVAELSKPVSESLGRFMHQRFQSKIRPLPPPKSHRGAFPDLQPEPEPEPSSASLASSSSTSGFGASLRRRPQADEVVRELAAAMCASSGDTPPWLSSAVKADVPDVERGLNELMKDYVDAHAAEHRAHRNAVRSELDSTGKLSAGFEPEPEQDPYLAAEASEPLMRTAQLLELKEETMPGVLQHDSEGAAGSDDPNIEAALDRLGMGSSQLSDEFGLSSGSVVQLYRTLYVFLFGFNNAVGSVLEATLPTVNDRGVPIPGTSGSEVSTAVRPRLWRAYFMLVDLMISSCYSRKVEEAQLQALGPGGAARDEIAAQQDALLQLQAEQDERVETMQAEITQLKLQLGEADREKFAQDVELERLETKEADLIAAYQALTSSATLRRFELDERLERGASKKLMESVFGAGKSRLDETATSQKNLARELAAERAKEKKKIDLDDTSLG